MDIDTARSYIRDHHHAVLATRRRDGSPQLSPVAIAVLSNGLIVISSRETAMKTRNIRRDPVVSICVIQDGFFGEWVQLDGTAEVLSLPEAMENLIDYYRAVAGEHPDWEEYRSAMAREKRVMLVVTPTRAGPNQSG